MPLLEKMVERAGYNVASVELHSAGRRLTVFAFDTVYPFTGSPITPGATAQAFGFRLARCVKLTTLYAGYGAAW